ncbi:unnamed protein product [Effrenium voratum]|nr:unnamed protein product [Effrenium voratum]
MATQTMTMTLPRTITAPPPSHHRTFLFQPVRSMSAGIQIQRKETVQAQVHAPLEAENKEQVTGLTAWLGRVGLLPLKASIEAWAQDEGAAFVEEVLSNAPALAQALQLTGDESDRFVARLRGQPPPQPAPPRPTQVKVLKKEKILPVHASPCPCCGKPERLLWDVTIASQHEGWGRKWNECRYACPLCRRHISRTLPVNACRDCKVMWHSDCNKALQIDIEAKKPNLGQLHLYGAVMKVTKRRQGPSPPVATQAPTPRLLRTITAAPVVVAAPGGCLDRTRTSPQTPQEIQAAAARAAKAYVPLKAWNFSAMPLKQKVRQSPRDAPLSRDEVLIEETDALPGQMDRRIILERQHRLRDERRERADQELLRQRIPRDEELVHPFQKEMDEEREERKVNHVDISKKGFSGVQEDLMRVHGETIKDSLGRVFDGKLKMERAQVSRPVQDRFMSAMAEGHPIMPTFHGSSAQNYSSICERGLLIPGRGNDLRVAHGSAHGLGIYTANVSCPGLSVGFCTAPKMLVCGVLDDSSLASRARTCGNFSVKAESRVVKHVGDAVVVFDESRVVPLWQVSANSFRNRYLRASAPATQGANAVLGQWAPPAQAASASATWNPNQQGPTMGLLDAGKSKVYHVQTGQLGFLPLQPSDYHYEIRQKRVFEDKVRDKKMKYLRQEKIDRRGCMRFSRVAARGVRVKGG